MKLESMNSLGNWNVIDPDYVDYYLKQIVGFYSIDSDGNICFKHQSQAVREITREEVIEALETGVKFKYDSDWYSNVRKYREPKPEPVTEDKIVLCKCGHTVPRGQVMNASLGTSCPDCYDRMSN
jgi:hypothetical protein